MATQRKKRVSANISESETKAERFVRVVTPRVQKAVKRIQQVGFCAGSTYEYTPEQAIQIIAALSVALDAIEANFARKQDAQQGFKFNT